ncbi:MAG: hypothetical protein AB7U82_21215 [Blastocatellales bacterium]
MIPLFVSLVFFKRERRPSRRASLAVFCCRCGAVIGLAGGLLAGIFGSAFTAASWLAGASSLADLFHQIGSVLLLATIPLLLLGGFCLDGVWPGAASRNR